MPQDTLRFSHLLELLGPGLLGFPEAILSLLGLLEAPHDLLVVGVLLPVLDLLEVVVQEAVLHLLVQLAHLVRLRHDRGPRLLQAAILGTWGPRGQLRVTPLPLPPPFLPGEAVTVQGDPGVPGKPSPWGSHGTFLDELPPPLGPVGELLGVGLLDLGPLVHAVHEVIAESVSIIDPLHRALVVPHLGWGWGQAGVGAVTVLPGSAPAGLGWLQGKHQAVWGCRDGALG